MSSVPLRHRDDQILAVVGHVAVELPLLLVGPLVDEDVLGLRRAELVEVELLEVVRALQVSRPSRARGTGRSRSPMPSLVHEARRELDPLEMVVAILAGGHVADLPLGPVGAGRGEAVGEQLAVLAEPRPRERDGAVLGQRVGVDQQLRLAVELVGGVEDALVLEPRVARVAVDRAFLAGDAELLVVPERGQPLLDGVALGDLLKVAKGDLVLGLDPGAGGGESGSSRGR